MRKVLWLAASGLLVWILVLASGPLGVESPWMTLPTHTGKPNRLIHERSPYLLQHAWNPVDWHPWGPEAFEKARKENKPIFLSIGYSTCHWCHVMEHESFENPRIAALLNDGFVAIKVDREERPDLDQIYMLATQAMTGSGGWPMSVWLTHDLKPFFAGTYFPPESRYGRPGFPDILKHIHRVWTEERGKIDQTSQRVAEVLQGMMKETEGGPLAPSVVVAAGDSFAQGYDPQWGGFGGAPKFPRAVQFPFLFRCQDSQGNFKAREMAFHTLQCMARGGMYDQLGGGFHRYSVDEEWRVPHFEKMLYDNAQLLSVYTEAWQLTGDDFYKKVADGIVGYVSGKMTDDGGAFYSAEDADSEGVEGTFYVWTTEELEKLLGVEDAKVVATHYDFKPGGNFEHGKNVLHGIHTVQKTAGALGKKEDEVRSVLEASFKKMRVFREDRPHPYLDDKILTCWNGLMIQSLARAGRVFGDPELVVRAERAANFLLSRLKDPESGRLLRRYRKGDIRGNAFLDDYAFFIAGLLELHQATQDPVWLKEAIRLMDEQVRLLWDEQGGAFYFASGEDASLLWRAKGDHEGAEPSGNSVAVLNLFHLAHLTGRADYQKKAEKTLGVFSGRIRQNPTAMPLMLAAYMENLAHSRQVVVAGDPSSVEFSEFWREINRHWMPGAILLQADGGARQGEMAVLLPFLKDLKPLNGKTTVYVCENFACQAPVQDLATLRKILGEKAVMHDNAPQR